MPRDASKIENNILMRLIAFKNTVWCHILRYDSGQPTTGVKWGKTLSEHSGMFYNHIVRQYVEYWFAHSWDETKAIVFGVPRSSIQLDTCRVVCGFKAFRCWPPLHASFRTPFCGHQHCITTCSSGLKTRAPSMKRQLQLWGWGVGSPHLQFQSSGWGSPRALRNCLYHRVDD